MPASIETEVAPRRYARRENQAADLKTMMQGKI
jgi:hypothetical protein